MFDFEISSDENANFNMNYSSIILLIRIIEKAVVMDLIIHIIK